MSYNITLTNGATLLTLSDGTIDTTTTSLNLVGRGATNYGTSFAGNFVHLLENFANTTSPPSPITGQVWFDSGRNVLRCYNGTQWDALVSASNSSQFFLAGTGSPSTSIGSIGEFYLDTTNGRIYGPKGTQGWASARISVAETHIGGTTGVLFVGVDIPDGTIGSDGDWYYDQTTSTLYGPRISGSWVEKGSLGTACTAGSKAPSDGKAGDLFFDTNLGILFIRASDGNTDVWIDITSTGDYRNFFSANAATQSLLNGIATPITCVTTKSASFGTWDGTNTFTILTAGTYILEAAANGTITWSGSQQGTLAINIYVNGVSVSGNSETNSTNAFQVANSMSLVLNVGDTVKVEATATVASFSSASISSGHLNITSI